MNENENGEAIEFPAKSFTPVKAVTVYFVPAVNGAIGVTVQVMLSAANDTARSTLLKDASVNEIFCHIMVEDCICSLNIIVTTVFTGTPVAPFAGVVDETVGGVVSPAPAAVVADAIFDGVPMST